MRRFRFNYEMVLSFSEPVRYHTFLFRFRPGSSPRQQVWGYEAVCTPASRLPFQKDSFGNRYAVGHYEPWHDRLTVVCSGEACIRNADYPEACPEMLLLPTDLTMPDAAIREMGNGLAAMRPEDALTAACERVGKRVEYKKGVTNQRTTAAEALKLGSGVCQDLAHLTLSVLRAQGFACRYAAGLIPGEGESHAWAEVWNGRGFYGFDPTHHRPVDDSYLRVNVGRDSLDCDINRGVFAGLGTQSLKVNAKMFEI